MKIRHKVIQDFQFVSDDKKIFVLKLGSILEEYVFKTKGEEIPIDRDIIDNNPLYFQIIDWKSELLMYLKLNKIPQPSQISKKLIPFIDDMILSSMPKTIATDDKESKELEKLYRQKLKEITQREFDIDKKDRDNIKSISDRESDYEISMERLEKKSADFKEQLLNFEENESNIKKSE